MYYTLITFGQEIYKRKGQRLSQDKKYSKETHTKRKRSERNITRKNVKR